MLSSLHTNNAPSAVTRLLDLGIEAFPISDSIIAVIGERLVRRICRECKVSDPLTPRFMRRLPPQIVRDKGTSFWKGLGCEACHYTGYSGRLGLFEIMIMTSSLKRAISPRVSSVFLKEVAEKEGFQTMTIDGIKKALQGLTTIEEVFRVAPPEAKEIPLVPIAESSVLEEIEAGEEPVVEEPPQSISNIRPQKILVADDNEIVLNILRNLLEYENYLVITAEDGLEAMKFSLKEKPDLIITDYLMPKMNGIDFIRKLKSKLTTRYIPIIMLTAKGEVDSEVKGIDAGADDYLAKPVNLKRLLARIKRLLNRSLP